MKKRKYLTWRRLDGERCWALWSCMFEVLTVMLDGNETGLGQLGGRLLMHSTAVDTIRKKYTVLSPSPGKLPSKVAIAGAIEWVDSA